MSLRLAAAVTTTILLAGCTVGPNYTRPELPTPDQYRSVLQPQDAQSFADLPWTSVFNDAEMRAAIETALANNLDLKLAAERVEEYRARTRIARSYYGPEVRVAGNTAPAPGTPDDSTYTLGLTLNWEIDLFGRLRRANEVARAQMLATEDAQRGVVNTLVADVATTWLRLRAIDEELAIIRGTIESQTASLELVRSLKRNGVASGTEEAQALSQLASTRARLPRAEQDLAQTENLLRFLLGSAPGDVTRTPLATGFPVPESLPTGIPAQLLSRRPDLRQLENQLHAATANVGVAEADRFPYLSLGLTSFLGIISPELGRLLDGDDPASQLFSIGPYVDMPVFQSGRGVANVDVAESQARQAELAYRRGVLNAYREVADALIVTDKSRGVLAETRIRRDAARRVLNLQLKRYKAGVVSYLEVLDAERTLFAAEIDLSRSQLDQALGYVELYRALGGGWK